MNEILLYSIENVWYKQAYIHGFSLYAQTYFESVNIFQKMENNKRTFKEVLVIMSINYTREDYDCDSHRR